MLEAGFMDQIGERKNEHLDICLEKNVDFSSLRGNGFDSYEFQYDALPEINKNSISLETEFLGKKLSAPLMIGSMTGGTQKAQTINERLARASEKCQIPMALGSQRKMLEDPSVRATYCVKEKAPNLPLLFGNIGAVQLNYGLEVSHIHKLIEEVEADAFYFHLNPLQESIQPEGDTDFSHLLSKLKELIPQIKVPVFIKEVGAGISEVTAKKIKTLGVFGVETGGRGGTSWAYIESQRSKSEIKKKVGELFSQWGLSTAESIQICHKILNDKIVIASGGIRNGIEVAKALVLGASLVAIAHPFLIAAEKSTDCVVEEIERMKEELKTLMFVVGAKNIKELKKKKLCKK